MLYDLVKKFENVTGLAELQQQLIVTFAEDNYRIDIYKDSDPKNATPFHIRVYDQVFEQMDGNEGETEEKSMLVGLWRELLNIPEVKSASAEDCVRQTIKMLSDFQCTGDD